MFCKIPSKVNILQVNDKNYIFCHYNMLSVLKPFSTGLLFSGKNCIRIYSKHLSGTSTRYIWYYNSYIYIIYRILLYRNRHFYCIPQYDDHYLDFIVSLDNIIRVNAYNIQVCEVLSIKQVLIVKIITQKPINRCVEHFIFKQLGHFPQQLQLFTLKIL